ncbi:MAG: glycosyltransferase family 39 protein [Chloroflexota bacterium]
MVPSPTDERSLRNLALALLAVLLAALGQRLLAQEHLADGLVVYGLAGSIFVAALRHRVNQPSWESLLAAGRSVARPKPVWRRGLGLGALALSISLMWLALYRFDAQVGLPVAWYLYLSSIGLFLIAVYLFSGCTLSRPAFQPAHLVLLFILLLAAFLRLYHLDTLPAGLWYDEADNGLQVRRMIQDPAWRPVFVPSTNLPAHFLYLVLWAFRWLGQTTLALRLVAVLLGLLTVLAAYWCGRELYPGGRRLALVLAFFLAVSRWDINWSRIGMHGVSVPLFELLTLGLFLRALRTGCLPTFAWAGVSLGLGLSFYTPFRLFPVALGLFLAIWLVGRLRSGPLLPRLRAALPPLILFTAAALLTIAPVMQFAFDQPDVFWGRARKMSILNDPNATDLPAALVRNTTAHLLMFNYRGDPNGRHNLPGEPMLDAASGLFFVLGVLVSLWRLRQPRHVWLLLWLGIMLLGGILSVTFESPQSLRAIGALPAACALAVVPLEMLLAEAEAVFRRPPARRAIRLALLALLIGVAWANGHTYFYRQARDFRVWNAFATAETELAKQIQRLRGDYDLYFDPLLFRHLTTQFLLPDFDAYQTYDPAAVLPVADPSAGKKGIVLFIAPDSFATRALLQTYYPDARLEQFSHHYSDTTVLFTYVLDWPLIAGPHGLVGRYYRAGDTAPYFQRIDPVLDFDWLLDDPPVSFPLRADWQGVLNVPAYGLYQLAVASPGKAELWLDQSPLPLDDAGLSPAIRLPRGVHALHLVCQVDEPGVVRFLWRPSGESDWQTVPASALYHEPFDGHGLVGLFYPNDAWQGAPAFSRMDAMLAYYFHHLPLTRPYTVEWRGRLEIPQGGLWALGTEALSATWLELDGRQVLVNTEPNHYAQIELHLAPGWYDIRLRFLDAGDHSHVYLYWQPPDQPRQLIPSHYLYPPADGSWSAP